MTTAATAKRGTRKKAIHKHVEFAALWQEVYENGGSYREMRDKLDQLGHTCTREYVRQMVRSLGLPQPDNRTQKRDYFLEELHHLAGFGLGAHEIAQRLGLTCDALVRKIDQLRFHGLTHIRFPGYFRDEHEGEMA